MVDKLVTADWVQAHLDDPSVRLVEVDVDTEAYKESHLPGAVAFNWTTQLQDQTNRDIISKSSLDALLSAAGIDNNTHVVLYGDNNNWFAAYALWILELYGHANISLMDGGRVKWLADGRPTTDVVPTVAPTQYRAKDANLALEAGFLASVPLPSGNVWRDRLVGAAAHGDGDKDWAVMALEQARASGLA